MYVLEQQQSLINQLIDRTNDNFIGVSLLPTGYMCPANWGLPTLIIGIKLLIIKYRTMPLKGAD